jgi:hypothetical protein
MCYILPCHTVDRWQCCTPAAAAYYELCSYGRIAASGLTPPCRRWSTLTGRLHGIYLLGDAIASETVSIGLPDQKLTNL